jgi:hypothetical protein
MEISPSAADIDYSNHNQSKLPISEVVAIPAEEIEQESNKFKFPPLPG